jgi:pyruvate/2-oxoglutarate/acetoin dehydrogenase E1 component
MRTIQFREAIYEAMRKKCVMMTTVYLMGEEVAEYNVLIRHLKECLPNLRKESN